jgi:hypothetical protein
LGAGYKKSAGHPCHGNTHRYMRFEKASGSNRFYWKPVLLREPQPTDRCAYCGCLRGEPKFVVEVTA